MKSISLALSRQVVRAASHRFGAPGIPEFQEEQASMVRWAAPLRPQHTVPTCEMWTFNRHGKYATMAK